TVRSHSRDDLERKLAGAQRGHHEASPLVGRVRLVVAPAAPRGLDRWLPTALALFRRNEAAGSSRPWLCSAESWAEQFFLKCALAFGGRLLLRLSSASLSGIVSSTRIGATYRNVHGQRRWNVPTEPGVLQALELVKGPIVTPLERRFIAGQGHEGAGR